MECHDPGGPYGAKEAGEGPLHPAIPAIANAIHDACGIRIRELPFYPQRVLKLLARARRAEAGGARRLMMTLPELTVLRPSSVAEAVEALRANPGARLLAGGTDIVPNLKYGMYDTTRLVALRGLSRELRYVREEEGFFKLGALCTIDELSQQRRDAGAAPGARGGLRADRRPAAPPHGHAGRKPLPGHPLRVRATRPTSGAARWASA